MVNPFYNRSQRRLRAGWRIILHFLLYVVLTAIFVALIGIVIVATSGILLDPTSTEFYKQVNLIINTSPWMVLLYPFLSVGAGLLALWIAGRLFDRRKFIDFGFHLNRGWWLDFAFGCGLGAVLMGLIFLVELSAGWVTITGYNYKSPATTLPFWVLMLGGLFNYIAVGINEESLSRGYQLRNLAEGLHLPRISARTALLLAYLLSSSIFGALHLANPNSSLVSTVNLIIAGLLLGAGYVLTRELAIPIGLHITWNYFQGRVFGFPVSGGASNFSFIAIQQNGPLAWTGGKFGPEAGFIGLLAMLLGLALIWAWVRYRRGSVEIQDQLAVYEPQPAAAQPLPNPELTYQVPE